MSALIFVYGTLKNGFSRNQLLQAERYLGTAKTKPEYALFRMSSYPAMLNKKLAEQSHVEANNSIYGEIYEVSDECLINLDKVEGTDVDLFERLSIDILEFTLMRLPLSITAWQSLQNNTAQAYLFKRSVQGASNCGEYWHNRNAS